MLLGDKNEQNLLYIDIFEICKDKTMWFSTLNGFNLKK